MNSRLVIEVTPQDLEDMIGRAIEKAVGMLREDRLVSRSEAAKLIGKSPATIARMVQRGVINEKPVGGRPRYSMFELLNLKK